MKQQNQSRASRIESDYALNVVNPRRLPKSLSAELIEIEGNYNFKPHIGQLPDGAILLFVTHTHPEEDVTGGRLTVHTVLYRSSDGGRTWGRGRHVPEMVGAHEPAISVIDGLIFVTTHFCAGSYSDPHAGRGHPYSAIYRSGDSGRTFEAFCITGATLGFQDEAVSQTSRNIVKLPGGRLITGIDRNATESGILYSDDQGRTWDYKPVDIEGLETADHTMGENLFFHSPSGRLMMLARQDYTKVRFNLDVPFLPAYERRTGLDQFDGEILFEAVDDEFHWRPVRAVGFPSLMYPSIVDLGGSRQLFTYTVRETPPTGTGCVYPKVGVQAVVIEETSDGFMDFNLDEDIVIIDDCTPASQRNAGCFGNTIRLADGALLTPYSYPRIDADILALADNKAYLKPEVFNHYAGMQTCYRFRYETFVSDDRELMEMNLRRNFSALFLYAQCANKGGIGTRVTRWTL